jgi:predicted DNA binding CopG/RHH family protein
MHESTAATVPSAINFAELLAGLAAPQKKSSPVWNDDDLADDVATISYEKALRTQSRSRADGDAHRSQNSSAKKSNQNVALNLSPGFAPSSPQSSESDSSAHDFEKSEAKREQLRGTEESRKAASITIRLSGQEATQLRERAAEAGLTVSAYLRSCIFEAETLRTEVKETLSQLRLAAATEDQMSGATVVAPTSLWPVRLLNCWPLRLRTAKA